MRTLGDVYPEEQARLRELLVQYDRLGNLGAFAAAHIRGLLKRADEAAIQQDLTAMIRIFKEMRNCN